MIRFGPSGNSESFYNAGNKSTLQAPKWLHGLGLNAFEYSFGRGINISEGKARELGAEMKKYDVALSIHAPYYINFATTDSQKIENNYSYVYKTAALADKMQAGRIALHPGTCSKMDRRKAQGNALLAFDEILGKLKSEGLSHVLLCPETMGKINQLGTLDEVLEMCSLREDIVPTIDFGHLNARSMGGLKTRADFAVVLNRIEEKLGLDRLKRIHIHFSKIEFTEGGEKRHLTLSDTEYGPEFEPLAELIAKRDMRPVIICESKANMAEDALLLKQIYLEKKSEV